MNRYVRLVTPPLPPLAASIGLLALRLVAGLAFIHHGWGKIQNPFGWAGEDSTIPGFLLALAALSEFGGGIAWILGLLTPLASFGLLCTMSYATWFHVSSGDPFVGMGRSYEPALVYAMVALLFLLAGPGRLSLDALIFRRSKKA